MTFSKKVVAISGSPRSGFPNKKSFTEKILNLLLEGINPADLKIFYPHKMNINYCTACMSCWFKTPGKCAVKDDMQFLKQEIEDANVIILASPVYVYGFSAPVKAVLDRCFSMFDPFIISDEEGHCRHKRFKPREQTALLVSTCGFSERDNFDQISNHFRIICNSFAWAAGGEILVPASALGFMRDAYLEKYELVKKAGEEFASNGLISFETMQKISEETMTPAEYQELVNPFFKKLMDRNSVEPNT
jgi:multimeric flavodoxin WrbA